jgi:hypothetical protein
MLSKKLSIAWEIYFYQKNYIFNKNSKKKFQTFFWNFLSTLALSFDILQHFQWFFLYWQKDRFSRGQNDKNSPVLIDTHDSSSFLWGSPVSTANLAAILSSLVLFRGDLEQNRTKPGKSKRTKPDFAKCPLRQKPQYFILEINPIIGNNC